MKYLAIIPARYQSTRFPGKPLHLIGGKPVIQRVYEQVAKVSVFSDILVATDDERIYRCVDGFGGKAVMTSHSHRSGTDRCAEAYACFLDKYPINETVVVNIQGDEPFIQPQQIEELLSVFNDSTVEIATLVHTIQDVNLLSNPNVVKVVLSVTGKAMYFSRLPIPYSSNLVESQHGFYQHIGLYAYKGNVLLSIVKLPPSSLEITENLEQLRWLENDYSIKACISAYASTIAIDTIEDEEKAKEYLKQLNHKQQ